ncbi:MAG: thiamine phosphate synthase [Rhodocyclaceae bacterium]|nr:thiamine phosphate synthase [Rhodocyclaceae bacterium]
MKAGAFFDPRCLGLYLVTDAAACAPRSVEEVVRAAVRGGATCVQLREKDLSTRGFLARARMLKALLAPLEVPLIINDRLDIALAAGADGVHVGQSDMPPAEVRRWMPGGIVGLSVESADDVEAALESGVRLDYLGVSPVFATPTKTDAAPPLGLAGLAGIRALTRLPLVAIGGIGPANAADVLAAGADGLAVVSAICAAADPELAARGLAGTMRAARPRRPEA